MTATVTARPEALAALGAALYRLRAARRWPLRRAAREAGVSVTTVMRAEQGRSVQLAPAMGLAGAYGTTAGALLDGAVVVKTEGRT
jgi:transcriptional regulator with XRE-family HTH domain